MSNVLTRRGGLVKTKTQCWCQQTLDNNKLHTIPAVELEETQLRRCKLERGAYEESILKTNTTKMTSKPRIRILGRLTNNLLALTLMTHISRLAHALHPPTVRRWSCRVRPALDDEKSMLFYFEIIESGSTGPMERTGTTVVARGTFHVRCVRGRVARGGGYRCLRVCNEARCGRNG